MPFEEVFKTSGYIQNKFLHLKVFKISKKLALYASYKNEVLTDSIMQHASGSGKHIYFPKVVSGQRKLRFIRTEKKDGIASGSYDIPEPIGGEEISDVRELDIVIVPGVVFDIYGNRLGYGKGYYDRLLSDLKGRTVIIGLAYDFQIVREIPAEKHDVNMDVIVTEKRIIRPIPNSERSDIRWKS